MRADHDIWMACKSRGKRTRSKDGKKKFVSRKVQKQEDVSSNFKCNSVLLTDSSIMAEAKKIIGMVNELEALKLTTGEDYPRENRRLTDFCFHDIHGKAQPVEMLEVDNIYISGLILPLEETSDRNEDAGILCKGFGRAESWAISGYDDGLLIIWVSTKKADYHCVKPASIYKDLFCQLLCKAQASIEVYKKLTGGNSSLSLQELLEWIVPLMSCIDECLPGVSKRELIISWGRFIFDQLIGLDETSCNDDEVLGELPVLVALRDESERNEHCLLTKTFLSDEIQYAMLESKEQAAISLTSGSEDEDYPRPNRRLTDFSFHDTFGNTQPVEMLEVDTIYVSGLILPLEEIPVEEKVIEARCEEFGRVESWAISGYEDGSPVIWVSTKIADYYCLKPANNYKQIYDLLLGKAHACIDLYKRLSKSTGGNPELNLDVLLSGVVSSVSESISFPPCVSVRDLIISWGRFLYNELIGLDATSSVDDVIFRDLPVLVSLRDENKRTEDGISTKKFPLTGLPSTSLPICNGRKTTQSSDSEIEKEDSNTSAEVEDSRPEVDSICLTNKLEMVNSRRHQVVEDEYQAISFTAGEDYQRPNRRLTNFIFHDADGNPQTVEMLEVVNMYISGQVLPLEETLDQKKLTIVQCKKIGRIESWAISGYEDGLPVIWVSTKIADYECLEPSTSFHSLYNLFMGKAHSCIEIYKMLLRSTAGNPDMSLDELVDGAICSLMGIWNCPLGLSIRDLIISWGGFIYNELIGLDSTSSDDVIFSELPVLASLRDESDRNADCFPTKMISSTELQSNLRVNGRNITHASTSKSRPDFDMSVTTSWKHKRMRSKRTKIPPNAGFDMSVTTSWKHKRMRSKRTKIPPNADDSIKVSAIQIVEDEPTALSLTEGQDYQRTNRRLTDFNFHDSNGKTQLIEMLEVENLYVSGLILPLEKTSHEEKVKGVQCKDFGRVESWAISGYEDGIPIIWVSTKVADYECVKPAANYQSMYGLLLGKAHACIEIYKQVSGSNSDISLDELVGGVVRSIKGILNVPIESIRDLVITWGRFICDELTGLDATSSKEDMVFGESPVLTALRDESERITDCYAGKKVSVILSSIGDENRLIQSGMSSFLDDEVKQVKQNLLLKEKDSWRSLVQVKRQQPISPSYKLYMKINKDDIANEYPAPEYHMKTIDETDERTVYFGAETCDPCVLPRRMLHNWSLYTSELMFISLELIPMKTYEEINALTYGSGVVMDLEGSRFSLNPESNSSSGERSLVGATIFLGAIKEWVIEVEYSAVFISIRTETAWYRLGEPSKQYAPWYEPVLKTAKLALEIIKLLKMQTRVSRTSFQDVIKIISRINKDHPAYVSSNPFVVRRYMVVHGLVILQHMIENTDDRIKKCAFLTCLCDEVEKRCHTKWLAEENINLKKEKKFIRRATKVSAILKRKLMSATMTSLVDRIWGEYYNSSSQDLLQEHGQECEKEKRQKEIEMGEVEKNLSLKECNKHCLSSKHRKRLSSNTRIAWLGDMVGKTYEGDSLYKRAIVRGDVVTVGGSVLVEAHGSEEYPPICFVEYMFENSDARKLIHGRLMLRGCQTVLGNTADEREVFMTNDCVEFELWDVQHTVFIEIRCLPWGYQHRDSNAKHANTERQRAESRKNRGLSMEYFCKSLYWPDRGSFFCLQTELMGIGSGVCGSCKMMECKSEKEAFKLDMSKKSFTCHGTEYQVNDFIYVAPHHFFKNKEKEAVKKGSNMGLKTYAVCQLLEIKVRHASVEADSENVKVRVRRFFRPEDISAEKAYYSDIREVYYSKKEATLSAVALKGKCEVRREKDLLSANRTYNFEHIFFCKHLYDPKNGALSELPVGVNLSHSKEQTVNTHTNGEGKATGEDNTAVKDCLATLDIFAGCGGLSEGLEQSGVSNTKWAIEYDEQAADAFQLNHLEAFTCINNCNVILRAIMTKGGNVDDCISVSEDAELAAKLSENELMRLPQPGQVDFIIGGPPCQGFSGMNRHNQSKWSKVQCEMIPAFLSFVEYFRPKFVLLENVKNFVSFNKGQVFRLTLASLLEMGYQVRFGILEAGAFGVSQSRKRAFIWAASPLEALPEWPEPMHVFSGRELKVTLDTGTKYAAARSTKKGAPFRAITVRDAIGDLPIVGNGASLTAMEYKSVPVSWFQKSIRGDMLYLTDHIAKGMNEPNLIRCKRIPKRPGADWRDLPNEKVRLSCGKEVKLVEGFLAKTAIRCNKWKGLFGRLDWEGNFPTSVTDPRPMGKVGRCFHPEHDRILSVREYARAQGFPDSYHFAGMIKDKHRQIGNAVPPPLAFALGRKLKEAIDGK